MKKPTAQVQSVEKKTLVKVVRSRTVKMVHGALFFPEDAPSMIPERLMTRRLRVTLKETKGSEAIEEEARVAGATGVGGSGAGAILTLGDAEEEGLVEFEKNYFY